jgi:type IV pilus assembly protein PilM
LKIFSFMQSKTPRCGLDLGSSWAKTVRVSSSGKTAVLDSFARLPWTPKDLEGPSGQGLKVKALWEHLGLKDKVVVSSMAGHAVIVKRVFFKSGPAKELQKNINKEARQYIPFDLEDVYLDYQVLGPGDKKETVEVLLVASKKKVVQELINVMDHSGLSLGIVDVDAFALSNCFEFNYPELVQEPVYLLDIGGRQSVFAICLQGQPVFFREISFGGRQLTDIIARNLDISRKEAETIKIEGPSSRDSMEKGEISGEMAETIRSWAGEVKRLINFYQASASEAKQAGHLFLSGGGSLFTGTESILQDQLGIPTRHLDPWKNFKTSLNDFDAKYLDSVKPQFAVATGLALRGII